MKKFLILTGLLISAIVADSPARADYYNPNCSSYGSFDYCSGYDSYGGHYNYQGSQVGNFYYGSGRYESAGGDEYRHRWDRQQIGNTIYENHRFSTPYGDYNVRCTVQVIGSFVYTDCR